MTKPYNFGDLNEDSEITPFDSFKGDHIVATSESVYQDLQKKVFESYRAKYLSTNVVTTSTPTLSTISKTQPYTWSIKIDDFYPRVYQTKPMVNRSDYEVEIVMPDDSIECITREELVKYIGERKLIQENEVVRTMYDRFQVAAKLAGSDDDGDTGV